MKRKYTESNIEEQESNNEENLEAKNNKFKQITDQKVFQLYPEEETTLPTLILNCFRFFI